MIDLPVNEEHKDEYLDCYCNDLVLSVCDMANVLYKYHPVGGLAHIVIDDGNIEDGFIDFCLSECDKDTDLNVVTLLSRVVLLMMQNLTETQRTFVVNNHLDL